MKNTARTFVRILILVFITLALSYIVLAAAIVWGVRLHMIDLNSIKSPHIKRLTDWILANIAVKDIVSGVISGIVFAGLNSLLKWAYEKPK